jgi:hypothetical protein
MVEHIVHHQVVWTQGNASHLTSSLFKKSLQLVNLHEIIWSNALKTNKTADRFCDKNILAELQFFEIIFNWSSIAANVHEINRFYVCYEFAEI